MNFKKPIELDFLDSDYCRSVAKIFQVLALGFQAMGFEPLEKAKNNTLLSFPCIFILLDGIY